MRFLDFTRKTVIGGITGGFIGVELTKKKIGYPHSTGDAFALAITLGHAIGRIGCFLVGDCEGATCNLPWAITFPVDSYIVGPVHPTQLYECFLYYNTIIYIVFII